jgi:ADP-heptose:LPS heptosyltransferase
MHRASPDRGPVEGGVQPRAVFIGYNAVGDTLCSTAVLRRFRETHPSTLVTYVVQDVEYCRLLEACPEVDTVIYSQVMYIHGLKEFSMEWLMSLAIDHIHDTPLHHFDMSRLGALPNLMEVHIAEGLGQTLGFPITDTRPSIVLSEQDHRRTRPFVQRPYVVFSMHSVTNPPRQDGREGGVKSWPWENWAELARRIRARYGFDVIALGSERDMKPWIKEIRPLYGLPIRTVAALIQGAQSMIGLENGLAHLAAGLDASLVHLYSTLVPLSWAQHKGLSNYEFVYADPCEVSVDDIMDMLETVIERRRLAA